MLRPHYQESSIGAVDHEAYNAVRTNIQHHGNQPSLSEAQELFRNIPETKKAAAMQNFIREWGWEKSLEPIFDGFMRVDEVDRFVGVAVYHPRAYIDKKEEKSSLSPEDESLKRKESIKRDPGGMGKVSDVYPDFALRPYAFMRLEADQIAKKPHEDAWLRIIDNKSQTVELSIRETIELFQKNLQTKKGEPHSPVQYYCERTLGEELLKHAQAAYRLCRHTRAQLCAVFHLSALGAPEKVPSGDEILQTLQEVETLCHELRVRVPVEIRYRNLPLWEKICLHFSAVKEIFLPKKKEE